ARTSQDRVADTGAYVDEAIHEVRTVQAYAHEPEDQRAYAGRVEAAFGAGVRRIKQRALLIAAVIVATSIGAVSEVAGELQRAAGATERLLELLDTVPEIAPPVDPVPLPD